jgi:hypothetical protein
MEFVFGFFIGLFVGSVVFYVVYKNNKTKLDLIAQAIELKLSESETVAKIKAVFDKGGK